MQDVNEAHRWLEGFFDTLNMAKLSINTQPATNAHNSDARHAMTELMKTPGRSKLKSARKQQPLASVATKTASDKDPVATLLFQSNNNNFADKENSHSGLPWPPPAPPSSSTGGGGALTSAIRSPRAAAGPGKPRQQQRASGLRSPTKIASPRPVAHAASKSLAKTSSLTSISNLPTSPMLAEMDQMCRAPVPSSDIDDVTMHNSVKADKIKSKNPITTVATATEDLSLVLEQDEDEDQQHSHDDADKDMDVDGDDSAHFSNASTVPQDEHVDLSIIGEEAEDEDENDTAPQTRQSSSNPAHSDAPSVTAPAVITTAKARVASNASSVAEEADADTAVPLNDAPSTLRSNNPLSSSVGPSTGNNNSNTAKDNTRTPGGSSTASRFGGLGTFSAARVGFGSSPPQAPTTASKTRTSTGGARQLNFVGLPKKSLGLGLGLGRSWVGDSQGSSQASQENTGATQQQQAQQAVTATGAVKRKSLSQDDMMTHKTAKFDTTSTSTATAQDATAIEEAAAKARRDALANRMKSMQARQSTAAAGSNGLATASSSSRVSGIMGSLSLQSKPSSNVLPGGTAKPLVGTDTAATEASSTKSTMAASSLPAETVGAGSSTTTSTSTATRRPSVMDRVRSLEKVVAADNSTSAPSPSRIPSALSRPTSPVPSTNGQRRGLMSPSDSMNSFIAAGPSKIGSPAATSKVTSPSKLQFRSPIGSPTRLPTSIRSQQPSHASAHIIGSSTPKMSPPPPQSLQGPAANRQPMSITQQLALHDQSRSSSSARDTPAERMEVDDEQDTIRIVSLASKDDSMTINERNNAREADEGDADDEEDDEDERRGTKRLVSLPLPPTADADRLNGHDGSNEEVVVEKGRGALASAMEVGQSVMPGSFAQDDEVDVTETIEATNKSSQTLKKKTSQASVASTTSTQSQASASTGGGVLSSLFGKSTSKKQGESATKGGVKSIQLAAAAAKKEQEDRERKAALKEEREQKRLALLQKRQDEERARVEEERKARAELAEKKRKEREEAAAERAKLFKIKPKLDDDKRAKPGLPIKSADIGKPQAMRPPVGPPGANQFSALGSSQNRNPLASSQGRPGTSNSAHNTPGNGLKSTQSSATGQQQAKSMIGVKFMAQPGGSASAPRAAQKAHGQQQPTSAHRPAPPPPVAVPEPEIELPDIDSEYSDSGDEAHEAKVKALPNWAQSPALAAALYRQQHVDPRDIFGPIQPLSMQEIFRSNHTRFTKRTSSAIWEGTDALTADDLARYNHKMGYVKTTTTTTTTTTS
ncbi:hypothetical protein OIO90_005559 [Microbotryomycetes sp. JL221]|nr:hypothetical protein OIO90_005559 [Microbotryomycetes sp. JL221]